MEELECHEECDCECKSNKPLIYAGMIVAGISVLALSTFMVMKRLKKDE